MAGAIIENAAARTALIGIKYLRQERALTLLRKHQKNWNAREE
jgi:hypothetical protein